MLTPQKTPKRDIHPNAANDPNVAEIFKHHFKDLFNEEFPSTEKNSFNGYYEWHYNPDLLTQLLRVQAHHESAIHCKTDTAAMGYRPHLNNKYFKSWKKLQLLNTAMDGLEKQIKDQPENTKELLDNLMSLQEEASSEDLAIDVQEFNNFFPPDQIKAAVFDFCYLGNAFLHVTNSGIKHLYARTMRVGLANDSGIITEYYQVINDAVVNKFPFDEIIHIKNYGPESSIYGTPGYLGAKFSTILFQAYEKLFMRFLQNGAHLGHIFLFNISYSDYDEKTKKSQKEEELKKSIQDAKGTGNGGNFYLNLGGITNDNGPIEIDKLIKIIPMGELIAKLKIDKDAAENQRDTILSAHRISPEIVAVIVDQKSGGDLDKKVKLYNKNTVRPIQDQFKNAVNSKIDPEYWIDFDPYKVGE